MDEEGDACTREVGRKVKRWWDEWVVGKIGYPASKSQDFWREVQDPPCSFYFQVPLL